MPPKRSWGAIPIDGGWSWVVMSAVMLSTFLEMGLYKSFGIFFVEYMEKFGSSASTVSVISGIYLGGYSFTALFVMTYGLERITCRQSVMLGGVFLFLGYLLSGVATSIDVVFVAQGIFAALGSGFVHGPSLVILSKYFDKRRGLSNSFAISCGSLGGLVLPILFYEFVEMYMLEGALMLTASLALNCVLAGALMRPTSFYETVEEEKLTKPLVTKTEKPQSNGMPEKIIIKSKPTDPVKVFLTGSHDLRQKKSNINEYFGSSISLTHIPELIHEVVAHSKQSVAENSKCGRLPCVAMSKIFDCSLFRNTVFVLLLIGGCLGQIECALAHIFIPPYAKDQGIAPALIPMIAGTIGIAEFVGRVIVGIIADVRCVKRYGIMSSALILTGTVTHFVNFYDTFWTFELFATIYGVFSGVLIALYSPVCVDLIGIQRFQNTYGICTCIHGIVISVSAPLFGLLRDVTGSYVLSFHIMGGCALLGGIALLLLPVAIRYEAAKEKKTSDLMKHLTTTDII